MKTAMQQLLQIVNNNIKNAHILKNNGLNNVDDINTLISTYNYFKIIIERDMLEKEKEQICLAFDEGGEVFADDGHIIKGFEYYNETYNQNN